MLKHLIQPCLMIAGPSPSLQLTQATEQPQPKFRCPTCLIVSVAESEKTNALKTVAFCSRDPRGVEGPRGRRHPAPPGWPRWVCSAPKQPCLRWEGGSVRRPAFGSCGSSVLTGYSPLWEGPVAGGGRAVASRWCLLDFPGWFYPRPRSLLHWADWDGGSPPSILWDWFPGPATLLGHCVPVCGTAGPAGSSSGFLEGVC